jgi:hypothetical protein
MMNFVVLSRRVTVEGPVTLYAGPFGFLWVSTRPQLESNKVVQQMDYLYNNNRFTYVSKSLAPPWPPEAPKERQMGFRPAIKSAHASVKENKNRDVTQQLKRLAGPRGDWHLNQFSPRDVFGADCSQVVITDVLGNDREVDGGDPFYSSSGSVASDAK